MTASVPSCSVDVGAAFIDNAGIDVWPEGGKVLVQGWARGLEDHVAHVLLTPAQARELAAALVRFAALVEGK